MKKMKILVTGGAGFIGSHIVDAYIHEGHEVVVLDDLSTGKRENLNPKAKFYEMDIGDSKILNVFEKEKPEILNHHAAQIDVRKSVADPVFDCKINVVGFLNLMEAARKSGVKKVIFASSGGVVYGEQKEFPAVEDHPTNPISPYGVAKLMSEKYLYYYYVQYGISYVAFRYANVYGPRQNPHGEAGVVAIFINRMLAEEQPVINGTGKQTRDYVYVKDVAELNLRALRSNASDSFNVGTGVETDVNKLFEILRELLGSRCEEKHVPEKHGEQARSSIVSKKIKTIMSYEPETQLADGLKKTAKWFKEGTDQL